ncbi:unnamed protein product [Peronospora destructor]|uniref:Uncharacterized protein n=1 Tax=Peronospora destructor TaxID=86335 RepID=A0AAV0UM53_9STRA|nr:unnamed protein product [Peronospora destructor]
MPRRAPPPPIPTFAPEPSPETPPEQEQTELDTDIELLSKPKHRGLTRVIGDLFKRKGSDEDNVTAPSDSEASQHRTSRWSQWSHRQSLPAAPPEMAAMTEQASALIHKITSSRSVEPDDKKKNEEPALRSSSLDNLHEQDIRPSLQAKMPLFLSVPLGEKMRRSGILLDLKEYEL